MNPLEEKNALLCVRAFVRACMHTLFSQYCCTYSIVNFFLGPKSSKDLIVQLFQQP